MNKPRVGVGIIVCKGEEVLLGLRKGAHGSNEWSFPGGHLEYGETIFGCATRELLEETGLTCSSLSLGPYTNDIFQEDSKHYITLFVVAEFNGGSPCIKEEGKCQEWKWFRWRELPNPLFLPIKHLIEQGFRLESR